MKRDAGAIASFWAYALATWWPARELPYFWDAAPNLIFSAYRMLVSNFESIVPFHFQFAHPPLMHLLLALAWRIFGDSRLVAHLVSLPFLPVAMAAIYLAGRRIDGRAVGFAAAFAFATNALVLAEHAQVYVELPMTALAACGLAAWFYDRRALAAAFFCAATLTKVPALVVPASLALLVPLRPASRFEARAYAALLAPLATAIAWGAYHAHVMGWWFMSPDESARFRVHEVRAFVDHVRLGVDLSFVHGYRWLLLFALVAGVVVSYVRAGRKFGPDVLAPQAAELGAIVIVTTVFFATSNEFLTRYCLVALPAFTLLAMHAAHRALSNERAFGAFAALTAIVFVSRWHPKIERTSDFELQPPEDMSFVDIVEIGRAEGAWLEAQHPDAEVYGGFHESYMLGQPFQGYVTRPLSFTPCRAFELHPGAQQLVVIHGYAPEQRLCQKIVRTYPSRAIKRFEANGKWLEIHRVLGGGPDTPAPASGPVEGLH